MTILVKVTVRTLCAMNCCQPVSSRMACIFFEFHIHPSSFFLSRPRWCQNPLNHFFHSGSLPFISSDLFVAVRPRLHHGLAAKNQGNWSRSSMTSANSCRRPPVFLWQIVLDVKLPVHVAVPLEKSLSWGLGWWPSAVPWVVPFLGCQGLEACSTYNICRFGVVCLCLSQAFAQGAPRGEHLALRIFTILPMISFFFISHNLIHSHRPRKPCDVVDLRRSWRIRWVSNLKYLEIMKFATWISWIWMNYSDHMILAMASNNISL